MLFIDLLKKAADVSYKKSAFDQFCIKESSYSLSDLYTYYYESIREMVARLRRNNAKLHTEKGVQDRRN